MLTRQVVRRASQSAAARSSFSSLVVRHTFGPQVATRTFATIIQQGTEGWRLSLGRNPVKLDPGLRLNIPFYHQVLEVDMREQSVDIKELSGFTSDNVPVSISGSLFFKVRNSYDACFAVDNFAKNVAYIGTSAMRSVIGHFTYDEVIGDRNAINKKLHDVIGESIQKWGVECTRFEIQHFHPSNRDVEKQLELQMAAERERRKKILDTQAMVNVAEGHKQRVILESEGALESQLNNSAGAKRKLILESEGTLEASKNEGKALAAQVDILARALSPSSSSSSGSSEPTTEHKEKALDALLELKRLEQLRAIALGQGNATYFFGSGNGDGNSKVSGLGAGGAYGVENWESWKRAAGVRGSSGTSGVDGVTENLLDSSSGNNITSTNRSSSRVDPKLDVPFTPPIA